MTDMTLHIVRHGDAVGPDIDPQRPLSRHGVEEITLVATALAGAGVSVERVVHSGKVRAQQTAEILAGHLAPKAIPQHLPGLNPNDDPGSVVTYVNAETDNTLIAGHMPSVGLIVRALVPNAPVEYMNFATGMVVTLTRDAHETWRISGKVTPRDL